MVAILACVALVVITSSAHANPTGFAKPAMTAVATTSPAVMNPGTGTSTVVYDAYGINGTNESQSGSTYVADSAILLVQFSASSTASKLKVAYEYSQDGIDWYQDGVVAQLASTTPGVMPVSVPNSFTWTFASTSVGGAAVTANNSVSTLALPVATPTRYVRAVISDTGNNAMVWAQFIPKKENK